MYRSDYNSFEFNRLIILEVSWQLFFIFQLFEKPKPPAFESFNLHKFCFLEQLKGHDQQHKAIDS
jgi:hypothetical protein